MSGVDPANVEINWNSVSPDEASNPEECTVFARNLGFEITDDQLEKVFEDIGPVKRAFVVTDRASKKSKGFGFVQFATRGDAERAVTSLQAKEIGGRKLKLEMAGKTNQHKSAKAAKSTAAASAASGGVASADAAAKAEEEKAKQRELRRTKNIKRVIETRGGHRMLVLTGLPKDVTESELHKSLKAFGTVEALIFPAPDGEALGDKSHAAARVQFSSKAETGACALGLKTVRTAPVKVTLLDAKAARLIVRNLRYTTTEDTIRKLASEFGTVKDVHLPLADGKARGFGFVQFESLSAAAAAIKKLSKIDGRNVAADWALAKDSYIAVRDSAANAEGADESADTKTATAKPAKAAPKSKPEKSKSKSAAAAEDDDGSDEDGPAPATGGDDSALGVVDMMDDEDEQDNKPIGKKERQSIKIKSEDEENGAAAEDDAEGSDGEGESRSELPSDADESSGGEDEDGEGEDSDSAMADADSKDGGDDGSGSEGEGEGDESDGEGEDAEDGDTTGHDESDAVTEQKIQSAIDRQKSSDVGKGTTVFVRNLLFETTEDQLLERFKEFGPIKFAKIVMDKEKGYSRGSGFVQFRNKDDAERVLEKSAASADSFSSASQASKYKKAHVSSVFTAGAGGIELGGRTLLVTRAVDRDEATKLKAESDVKKEDRRNLYLAREGLILSNSESAEGVSPSDLEKRNAAYKEKKQKLKNPNFFISKTRLSIRNLPLELKDSSLKKICLDALKKSMPTGGKPTLKQVKIVRSTDRFDAAGVGRSKRYGFVELTVHEHALKLLRALNNNPNIFNRDHRPIVEFALEDHRKLLVRKKRDERAQQQKQQKAQLKSLIADDPRTSAPAVSATGITTAQSAAVTQLTPKQIRQNERQLAKRAARTERKIAREAAEAAAKSESAPANDDSGSGSGSGDAEMKPAKPTKQAKSPQPKPQPKTPKQSAPPAPVATASAAAADPKPASKQKSKPVAPSPAAAENDEAMSDAPAKPAVAATSLQRTPNKPAAPKPAPAATASAGAAPATTPKAKANGKPPAAPSPAPSAPASAAKPKAAPAPKPAADGDATASGDGAAGTAAVGKKDKSKCYKCKQTGHRAKDCTNAKLSSADSKKLIVAEAKAKTAAAKSNASAAAAAGANAQAKPQTAKSPKQPPKSKLVPPIGTPSADGSASAHPIAEKPAPFNPALKCYQCKKHGHRAKDCPTPKPKAAASAGSGGGGDKSKPNGTNKRKNDSAADAKSTGGDGDGDGGDSGSGSGSAARGNTKRRKKNERQDRDELDSMIDAYKAKLAPSAVAAGADKWF